MSKSILDKDFKYTPAVGTDIRKAFDKAREKLEAEKKRAAELIAEAEKVVAKTRIKGKV